MVKKKKLQEIVDNYNPGKFRKIAGMIGLSSQASANMHQLTALLASIKTDMLSAIDIKNVEAILILETNKGSETDRVFTLIKEEIARAQLEQQRNEWISRALHAALKVWTQSHYYDCSRSLVRATHEVAPRFSEPTLAYAEHILGILYLALSCYGIKKYTTFSVMVAGKLPQIVGQNLDFVNRMNPTLRWFIGLGLQLGLDFVSGVGGVWVVSYVAGSVFETLTSRIFDTVKLKISGPGQQRYPHSEVLLKKILTGMAFCGGSILGQSVYYRISHSEVPPPKQEAEHQETFHQEEAKPQEQSRPVVKLTNKESDLLFNTKNCKFEIRECHRAALRVLQLDPNRKYQKNEIRKAYKEVSMLWHPDKVKGEEAEKQMMIIVAANDALRILQ